MIQKRALIVDDSKSARVVLSKMLEKYELQVHAAESAEDAIAHLQAERPDVIFMDHLMPSMDGFQAVQAIKNDPRTATIPILMYTSQGGELYMGQARALGAIGVLPKQLGLTDVAKVLHQLHLLPERRPEATQVGQQALELPANSAAEAPAEPTHPAKESALAAAVSDAAAANNPSALPQSTAPAVDPAVAPVPVITERFIREAVEPLFSAQSAELRRFMLATLDGLALRSGTAPAEPRAPVVAPVTEPPAPRAPLGWIAATLLFAFAALAGGYYAWHARAELTSAQARLALLEQAVPVAAVAGAEPAAGAAPAPVDAPVSAPAPARSEPALPPRQVMPYGYGELPLAAQRLDALRALVAELTRRGATGTVHVTSYAADFCLTGNPAEGYVPAPEDMPANRCDLVGNPFDEGLRGAQRESRAFADYLSTLAGPTPGPIAVAVHHVAHARGAMAYPAAAEAQAASWNQAAVANQLVELRFEPRSAASAP